MLLGGKKVSSVMVESVDGGLIDTGDEAETLRKRWSQVKTDRGR